MTCCQWLQGARSEFTFGDASAATAAAEDDLFGADAAPSTSRGGSGSGAAKGGSKKKKGKKKGKK